MKAQLSVIMKSAWQLARSGAKAFGGRPKEYFACALAQAWQRFGARQPEVRSIWHAGLGNLYVLPGVAMPAGAPRRGQLGLPGIGQ